MASLKEKQVLNNKFQPLLLKHVEQFNKAVSSKDGDWIVKGFIDVARNIYTISVDTKVVSKIMELLLFPKLSRFAEENKLKMVLCKEQNFYPDISFIDADGRKFAVDLKSTYRTNHHEVNGMTLGAFTGYFRDRKSSKNITFPYGEYMGHFVLGIIYTRVPKILDEKRVYHIDELQKITAVIKDFSFFVQEKYKIASSRPGSGNTRNIGSVVKIEDLTNGKGPFAELGDEVFDDYWRYYMTQDMARAMDLKAAPYKNLKEYFAYKKLKTT